MSAPSSAKKLKLAAGHAVMMQRPQPAGSTTVAGKAVSAPKPTGKPEKPANASGAQASGGATPAGDHTVERKKLKAKKLTAQDTDSKVEKSKPAPPVPATSNPVKVPKKEKGAAAPAPAATAPVAATKSIDDLFAGIGKRKEAAKQKRQEEEEKVMIEAAAAKKAAKEARAERAAFLGDMDNLQAVGRTEEGYPIYTEDSLRIGQGGGTKDCPFDCNCCFG